MSYTARIRKQGVRISVVGGLGVRFEGRPLKRPEDATTSIQGIHGGHLITFSVLFSPC